MCSAGDRVDAPWTMALPPAFIQNIFRDNRQGGTATSSTWDSESMCSLQSLVLKKCQESIDGDRLVIGVVFVIAH